MICRAATRDPSRSRRRIAGGVTRVAVPTRRRKPLGAELARRSGGTKALASIWAPEANGAEIKRFPEAFVRGTSRANSAGRRLRLRGVSRVVAAGIGILAAMWPILADLLREVLRWIHAH